MGIRQMAIGLVVAAALALPYQAPGRDVPAQTLPPDPAGPALFEVRPAGLGPPASQATVAIGGNWAGYLANAEGNPTAYTGVSAEFIQPRVSLRACQPESDVSTWVGIGGFNVNHQRRMLIQAGTAVDIDLHRDARPWAWYQYLVTDLAGRQVGGNETTRLDLVVRAGDRIQVRVSVGAVTTFDVRNLTTGGRAAAAVPLDLGDLYDGSTAEAITERSVRLARFDAVRWHWAQVQRPDGTWRDLLAEPGLTEVRMLGGRGTIAAPGPAGTGFQTTWRGCG